MPALDTTIVASTSHEIKLKPSVRQKLLNKLQAYARLHVQKKAIEAALEAQKAEIGKLRDETGEQSLSIAGFKVTLVAPIRHVFDAKKFVSLGGDLALYNNAHVDKPGRGYEKITLPGAQADDE